MAKIKLIAICIIIFTSCVNRDGNELSDGTLIADDYNRTNEVVTDSVNSEVNIFQSSNCYDFNFVLGELTENKPDSKFCYQLVGKNINEGVLMQYSDQQMLWKGERDANYLNQKWDWVYTSFELEKTGNNFKTNLLVKDSLLVMIISQKFGVTDILFVDHGLHPYGYVQFHPISTSKPNGVSFLSVVEENSIIVVDTTIVEMITKIDIASLNWLSEEILTKRNNIEVIYVIKSDLNSKNPIWMNFVWDQIPRYWGAR